MQTISVARLSLDDLARIGHTAMYLSAPNELELAGVEAVMAEMQRRGLDPQLTMERGSPVPGKGQPESVAEEVRAHKNA